MIVSIIPISTSLVTDNLVQSNFVQSQETEIITIVFDYSHEQTYDYGFDLALNDTLVSQGYNVVWAEELNSSILENASALIAGSVTYQNLYHDTEIDVISSWFNQGGKFLWLGCDSDYNNLYTFNENIIKILEPVHSHVYPEQVIINAEENVVGNQASKVLANITTQNPRFASVVDNVTNVLMAHATTLYGSNNSIPGQSVNPINLESNNITDVYQLLYYNPTSYIDDGYSPSATVHRNHQVGAFVAVTLEDNAGCSGNGVLVVSGAPAYGQHDSICRTSYWGEDRPLDGQRFITQLIDFGVETAISYSTRPVLNLCSQTTPPQTTIDDYYPCVLLVSVTGIVVSIIVLYKRKKGV